MNDQLLHLIKDSVSRNKCLTLFFADSADIDLVKYPEGSSIEYLDTGAGLLKIPERNINLNALDKPSS